jgi:hypothetical protein
VSFPAWSESDKSWYFLVLSDKTEIGWSEGVWFPKKVCTLEKSEKEGTSIVTVPEWFWEKNIKKITAKYFAV